MNRSILFYDTSRHNLNQAPRVLAVCDGNTVVAKTEKEFETHLLKSHFDLLIYPIELYDKVQKGNHDHISTILLSETMLRDLTPVLHQSNATNILAKTPEGHLKSHELIATVHKIFNPNIFGVHHYLNQTCKSEVYHIRDSDERGIYIEALREFCEKMHVRTSIVQSVELFCEELLMNAIYDAPRDEKGQELYSRRSRKERVVLKLKEAARLEFACDGDKLVVSISDPFGAITWETIQKYLTKGFSNQRLQNLNREGGAGLGLYFCFNSANSLIVNVNPSVRTEFIGIFDLNFSPKVRQKTYSSVNFFLAQETSSDEASSYTLPFLQEVS